MLFARIKQAVLLILALPGVAQAQIDDDQVGAWYMYFFDAPLKASQWGFQGDVQYRNWDFGGDLEQLLLRGGLTWRPKSGDALLTLGYANITSGEFGSSSTTVSESRIYQEAALPQKSWRTHISSTQVSLRTALGRQSGFSHALSLRDFHEYPAESDRPQKGRLVPVLL